MGQAIRSKRVLVYEDEQGKEPFSEWFKGLKDIKGKERIGQESEDSVKDSMGIVSQLAKGLVNYECFLVRDTKSILVKRLTIL